MCTNSRGTSREAWTWGKVSLGWPPCEFHAPPCRPLPRPRSRLCPALGGSRWPLSGARWTERRARKGSPGRASPPCTAAACFSRAVVVAPPAVTRIHALDHGGSEEPVWGGSGQIHPQIVAEKILSPYLYSSGGSDLLYLISPLFCKRSVTFFVPGVMIFQQEPKRPPWGFPELNVVASSCHDLKGRLWTCSGSRTRESACAPLELRLKCLECGFLGICDAKTGKGCSSSPSPPSRFTLICVNLLINISHPSKWKQSLSVYPACLLDCPCFPPVWPATRHTAGASPTLRF